MPLDVVVRSLKQGDWMILRELRLAALKDSPKAFLSSSGERPSWAERDWRRTAERKPWFAAFADEIPVGLASVILDGTTGDHYVESMWVRPAFHGRGVAGALFGAVGDHVGELGGDVLRLWVLAGNDSAAMAYLRYGFPVDRPAPGIARASWAG